MHSSELDFDFLTKETMSLSQSFSDKMLQDSSEQIPATSGIIFVIANSGSSFSIRGEVVESIAEAFEFLRSGDRELVEKLCLDAKNLDLSTVEYFATKNLEQAEVIVDGLFNRRFPVDEDILCNLSDPGFSWWLDDKSEGLSIYFKSQGLDRSQNYVRLGPVGDSAIATIYFEELGRKLKGLIPFREFYCSEKEFLLSPVDVNNKNYQALKEVFLRGTPPCQLEMSQRILGKTLYFYLDGIAALRRFWLHIGSSFVENELVSI